MHRAADLLDGRADQFAAVISAEAGKPTAEALAEVGYSGEYLRWFAEPAAHVHGSNSTPPDGSTRALVSPRPVGPTLLITPWNFPLAMLAMLAMLARKLGAALAAGCAAIVKPAPQTPLTALLAGRLLSEAGLPKGVLSVLPTSQAASLVEPMLADPALRKLSFTGSTPVGRRLLVLAAPPPGRQPLKRQGRRGRSSGGAGRSGPRPGRRRRSTAQSARARRRRRNPSSRLSP